jgi:hypothetical protein
MMGASSWYTYGASRLRLPEHVSLVALHARTHAARRWGGCGVEWTLPRKGRRSTTRARPPSSSWRAQRGRRWRCAPRPAPPAAAAAAAAHMASGGGAPAIQDLCTPRRHRRHWALSRPRLPRCGPAPQPSRCCVGLTQRARHARRCAYATGLAERRRRADLAAGSDAQRQQAQLRCARRRGRRRRAVSAVIVNHRCLAGVGLVIAADPSLLQLEDVTFARLGQNISLPLPVPDQPPEAEPQGQDK